MTATPWRCRVGKHDLLRYAIVGYAQIGEGIWSKTHVEEGERCVDCGAKFSVTLTATPKRATLGLPYPEE